jgi:hypothetical protein
MALPAGAAGSGRAAGAGTGAAAGGRGQLAPHLSGTGAHQLFHLVLAAVGALHSGVGPEDQLLEILITALAVKFKNGHRPKFSFAIYVVGPGSSGLPARCLDWTWSQGGFRADLLPGTFILPYFFSIRTTAPSGTTLRQHGSSRSRPTRLTALAGRISPGTLPGVRPKKRQKARPVGQ